MASRDNGIRRTSHEWSGEYRGIAFSIRMTEQPESVKHGLSAEAWCHYIYLHEAQAADEATREKLFLPHRLDRFGPASPEHVTYDYMRSALADLEWHGGITYYELVCTVPAHRVLKAGCDYQHLYDNEVHWDERIVLAEVRRTVDSLLEAFPGLLVRDFQTGQYVPAPSESGAQ